MNWQRVVADVAMEVGKAGRLAHRDVIVTTPRQAGKSVLLQALLIHRLLSAEAQVLYGVQTRMLAARSRLFDGWWPRLQRSEFADRFTISRGAGFETLRADNGSILTLLRREERSGHGDTVDLSCLDETWAMEAYVEQAVRPATSTRPEAQIWAVSTAGSSRSVWWKGKVDAGRAAVAAAERDPVFLEWAAPAGADPGDPEVWRAAHPALGITIDEAVIAADYKAMPTNEFVRAYLNRWPGVDDEGWRVFDRESVGRWQL